MARYSWSTRTAHTTLERGSVFVLKPFTTDLVIHAKTLLTLARTFTGLVRSIRVIL
jgi:hypothetical protein